ncbi:MAG TPA: hypothetical protein PLX06_03935 [Fimbriimonadaceae bacterium]|nr:hypothetical protein [Fimbriimonadaceae bacterium]
MRLDSPARNVSSGTMSFGFEPPVPARIPPTWWWYVALCVLLALMNAGLVFGGVYLLQNGAELARSFDAPEDTFDETAIACLVSGPLFFVGNLILPFLPKKPWAYVLHMTNIIAAGLTCVFLPLAIPVFMGWMKQDVKDYFQFR